jgi:hypothetical protein
VPVAAPARPRPAEVRRWPRTAVGRACGGSRLPVASGGAHAAARGGGTRLGRLRLAGGRAQSSNAAQDLNLAARKPNSIMSNLSSIGLVLIWGCKTLIQRDPSEDGQPLKNKSTAADIGLYARGRGIILNPTDIC